MTRRSKPPRRPGGSANRASKKASTRARAAGGVSLVGGLAALTACGGDVLASSFRQSCEAIARIDVADPGLWDEYVGGLREEYRRNNIPGDYLKIGPLTGFDFTSSASDDGLRPSGIYDNVITISRDGRPVAVVHSKYLMRQFSGSVSTHDCVNDFPELFGLTR